MVRVDISFKEYRPFTFNMILRYFLIIPLCSIVIILKVNGDAYWLVAPLFSCRFNLSESKNIQFKTASVQSG